MSELEQLACGVIVVGFEGTKLSGELQALFARHQFAGYVLFARNVDGIAQVRALTDTLRSVHDIPPVIGVDQEGGRVMRLREGVEPIPSMMALGAAGRAVLAQRAGEQMAFDLRRAGCTIDFAPVLDLALDSQNTVIGTRSFGSDPVAVATLGEHLAAGLTSGGITPTYKHFPGHGATSSDSHVELPVVNVDAQLFDNRDIVPFERCLPHAAAVMTAHIVVPHVDSQPATNSRRLLTNLLREQFGFNGVCFTDCMQMDAIVRGVGTVEGICQAIAAGADCALVSHDPALALDAARGIVAAVRDGRLDYERLTEAHGRIERLRRASSMPIELDGAAPHTGIGREIARAAITVLRGSPHADPVAAIVVSFEGVTVEGVQGRHEEHVSLRREAPALAVRTAPLDPDAEEQRAIVHDVVASRRRPLVLMRRAHVYGNQLNAVRMLVERFPDAVVVSLREPYDCALVPQARHLLATYGDDTASIGALADVLFGNVLPAGSLPVSL